MEEFAFFWWKIGTLLDWQRKGRMQPAFAVIVSEYRTLIGLTP